MPVSDIILLILACLVLGAVLGVLGMYKLILYSFKNLSFDELKAKVAKFLKENGGELVCFDYDLNENIFEIKVSFPKLEEKVNAK